MPHILSMAPSHAAATHGKAGAPFPIKGDLHKMGFTTDMNEIDIVYGSEEKLCRAIIKTCETR